MKLKIDVDTKTFVRLLLVVTGFAVVIFMILKLAFALTIIGISFFLALALNPPVSKLAGKLPGHSRVLATALSYIIVLAVVGVFIYIALPPIIDQTNRFIGSFPGYIQDLSSQHGFAADFINRYNLQDELNQLVSGAQQQAAGVAQGLGSSVVSGVSSVLTGVISLITVLVLTFLMLIEGPTWLDRLWSLYYNKQKLQRHQKLAVKMYRVVASYVNGQVLVASISAAAGLTTLLLLATFFQVPLTAVIPLTGIIFLTDLVPVVGSTLGALIVFLVLLFSDPSAAVIYLVYFLVYQQIENNFIQPVVQSRTVALSALSIIVAILVGISLLGLVGGIVAIPIAGCIRVILIDYMEHRHKPTETATQKRKLWHRLTRAEAKAEEA
ncbi:MAG TPA: AI-2E family transporter [Candidatus Saccharimonas sp.]|nr:AI-2E family transporter [Candidatus Saccharimonas sp.]